MRQVGRMVENLLQGQNHLLHPPQAFKGVGFVGNSLEIRDPVIPGSYGISSLVDHAGSFWVVLSDQGRSGRY